MMKKYSVLEFLEHPLSDKYIYIYGYYQSENNVFFHKYITSEEARYIREECKKNQTPYIFLRNDTHGLTRYLLEKHRQENGYFGLVAKIMKNWRGYTSYPMMNILKADLLDENNNIIDSVKVGESEMPVELRGEI